MPINPLIALQTETPDLVQAISQGLSVRNQFDSARNRKKNNKLAGQERSVRNINTLKDAELSNAVSLSLLGQQITPLLESNDIEGVRNILVSRKNNLASLGVDSTQTDEALSLLDSDPGLLLERSKQAIQIGDAIKGQASERFFQPTEVVNEEGNRILIQASSSPDGKARILDFKPINKAEDAGNIEKKKIEGRESTRTGQSELSDKQFNARLKELKLKSAESAEISKSKSDIDILGVAQSLLGAKGFNGLFGFLQGRVPALTQDIVDADVDRERLVSLLSLENRKKLQGQGNISDFEGKQLGKAATILADRRISEEKARGAVEDIIDVFADKTDVELQSKQQQTFRSSSGIEFIVE